MIRGPGFTILLPPKTGTTYLVRECQRVGWQLHGRGQHDQRSKHTGLGKLYCSRRDPFDWYESLYRYLHQHSVGQKCLANLPVTAPFEDWIRAILIDPIPVNMGHLQRRVLADIRRLGCGLATYRVMQVALETPVSAIDTPRLPSGVEWLNTATLTSDLTALWMRHGVQGVPPSTNRAKVTRPRTDVVWTPATRLIVAELDRVLL